MRSLAEFAMRGRSQAATTAIALALLSLLIPFLSLVSTAIVGLVVLRKGWREGLVLTLGGCVVLALVGMGATGSPVITVGFGLMLWLPVALLAWVLRETRSLTLTLEVSLLLGAVGMIVLSFWQADLVSFWNSHLTSIVDLVIDKNDPAYDELSIESILASLSRFMTGLVVTGTLLNVFMGLLLARWWQSLLYNPGGFGEEFLSLRGRSTSAYTSVVFMILGLTASGWLAELALNLCILSVALYLLIGTSVLHTILARKEKKILLFVLYLTLFMIPHVLIPLALLGFTDTWANWRGRFAKGSHH